MKDKKDEIIEILKMAVEFYYNPTNWSTVVNSHGHTAVIADSGEIAFIALEEVKKLQGGE